MRKLMTFLAVAVAITLSTGISRADLLSGCGTCQGSTYLLQYDPANTTVDGGTGDHIYDVFLTIDTSGYDNVLGKFLNAVSVKIASSVDITTSSLVSAPGGTGSWTLGTGGINSGGCDGNGGGFICATDGTTAPVPNLTAAYTWEFHYETAAALEVGSLGSDVKAQYVNATGGKVGDLVSEGITLQPCSTADETCGIPGVGGPVPEPGTIILLGSGLLITFAKLRKRLVRS